MCRPRDSHYASITEYHFNSRSITAGYDGMRCRTRLVSSGFHPFTHTCPSLVSKPLQTQKNPVPIENDALENDQRTEIEAIAKSSPYAFPFLFSSFNLQERKPLNFFHDFFFSLVSLTICARESNYVCPEITSESILDIKGGRCVNLVIIITCKVY